MPREQRRRGGIFGGDGDGDGVGKCGDRVWGMVIAFSSLVVSFCCSVFGRVDLEFMGEGGDVGDGLGGRDLVLFDRILSGSVSENLCYKD